MNITNAEANRLFDTALDLLNNIDIENQADGKMTVTIYAEHHDALVAAVSAVMKENTRRALDLTHAYM